MATLVVEGFILVPDEDLEAVRQEFPVHVELTRAEPGCRVFHVAPHEGQPNRFDVYEEFASREAFEAHQARVERSRWGKVSSRAERRYQVVE